MKKIFTLMAMVIAASSANAQMKWMVTEDFVLNQASQTVEAKEGDKLIATLEILSSPTIDNLYEEMKDENGEKMRDAEGKPLYDETKPKSAWSRGGGPESNQNIDILEAGFHYYVRGMGNPVLSQDEGWVYDEAKDKWSYKVTNAVYWFPGCGELPKQGEYIKVTPTADGTLLAGIFLWKGPGVNDGVNGTGRGHQLYIIDESTKDAGYTVIPNTAISVKGYFNNNTWLYEETKKDDNGQDMYDEATGEKIKTYPLGETLPYSLTLADDYTLHTPDGVEKRLDRHFMGIIEFAVKANNTYWMLSPTTQLGLYGLKLTAGETGIRVIETSTNNNAPAYNIAGQRVDAAFKGIVIRNGKKIVKK